MEKQKIADSLMSTVNVFILLTIVLLYVVTGTGLGDDAIAALSDETVYRGKKDGAVALECIVSWDAAAVEDMLGVLRETDTQITFFVSGEWAKAHAETLETMIEDGHEIGSCGYAPTIDGDIGLVERDVSASALVIEQITGQRVELYNAGLRDRGTSADAAEALGLVHVASTADLLSARGDAADIALRASKQAFDGSILMILPTAEAARALPAVIDTIRECGLSVTTVGELLK